MKDFPCQILLGFFSVNLQNIIPYVVSIYSESQWDMACGWRGFRRTFLLEDWVNMVEFYINPRSHKHVYIEDITKR